MSILFKPELLDKLTKIGPKPTFFILYLPDKYICLEKRKWKIMG